MAVFLYVPQVTWEDAEKAFDRYARNLRSGTFDQDAQVLRSTALTTSSSYAQSGRQGKKRLKRRPQAAAEAQLTGSGLPAKGAEAAGSSSGSSSEAVESGPSDDEGPGCEEGSVPGAAAPAPVFDIRI